MATVQRVPIGDRIRSQRRTRGVTQRDLASSIGVSPAYLSLIESDKRQIGGRLLKRIAERLGVPTDAFTVVSDDRLASDLHEVAQRIEAAPPGMAAPLVAFSPEWARVVLELHTRAMTAEARAFRLADRFARDPQWTSFAHDILSRITSIRSAAEILSDDSPLDDAQRERFTDTVVAESARLTDVARDMIAALQSGTAVDAAGADVREVDAFLHDNNNYFGMIETLLEAHPLPPLEGSPSVRFAAARRAVEERFPTIVDDVVAGHEFRTEGAERRARGAIWRYAAGAAMMPYRPFLEAALDARYDLDELAARFRASFEQVAHRLATLRRPGEDGVPFAFLRVDPAGTVSKRLSTAALRLPLFGACPLWVVYETFAQPGRTLSQMVDLDGERFLLVARAVEKTPRRQAQPPTRFSVMLGVAAEHAGDVIYGDTYISHRDSVVTYAGYECLSCKRAGCQQRAHGAEVV
ncbi:helix-turn-helix domain-containing protein [Acuticoccus sp. I52.16.1]|uniref:helix-turn-helix domain-containing protein n=1 Tax=Acuticoccus sp. I52.16.1 TaxID=2928472 RepID=UPI001FD585E0|nr:short-chain fatty acyl-CoA regulator family protein [Acuticoccus sp. I52.16.1]UOM33346.1 short-chain fatty acyl-CoA regulator family protein [Acuticoccus sp. I52.16.1]